MLKNTLIIQVNLGAIHCSQILDSSLKYKKSLLSKDFGKAWFTAIEVPKDLYEIHKNAITLKQTKI